MYRYKTVSLRNATVASQELESLLQCLHLKRSIHGKTTSITLLILHVSICQIKLAATFPCHPDHSHPHTWPCLSVSLGTAHFGGIFQNLSGAGALLLHRL
ncbi:hypothetical protein AMECASPLE_004652 [Ameca splendens]|uniref:Uncharacterized protein n=1 Tax=Ameca splendens TaxID=208324 RepID=A0ABV0Y9Y9_9TELE